MSLTSNTKFLAQDGIDGTLSVPLGRENIQPVRPLSEAPLNLPANPVAGAAESPPPSVNQAVSSARSIWSLSLYALILVAIGALAWLKFR